MYTGEFSHQGTSCTFETLAQRFNIGDAAVARIAQIVHDLDMKEIRYAPPEAPAVGRMIDGLRELYADDDTLLQHGMGMFEALARSFSATESATLARPALASRRKGDDDEECRGVCLGGVGGGGGGGAGRGGGGLQRREGGGGGGNHSIEPN